MLVSYMYTSYIFVGYFVQLHADFTYIVWFLILISFT